MFSRLPRKVCMNLVHCCSAPYTSRMYRQPRMKLVGMLTSPACYRLAGTTKFHACTGFRRHIRACPLPLQAHHPWRIMLGHHDCHHPGHHLLCCHYDHRSPRSTACSEHRSWAAAASLPAVEAPCTAAPAGAVPLHATRLPGSSACTSCAADRSFVTRLSSCRFGSSLVGSERLMVAL
jgi:hypothetical protein